MEIFKVPDNLEEEMLDFFLRQDCYCLANLDNLKAELKLYVGVYALFYCGVNSLYNCLSVANSHRCCLPIYIGKAVVGGRRIGITSKTQNLYSRLREHRRSIERGDGLEIEEFQFKVIAMEIDLVSWGEGVMIRHFQPVWNQIIDGFGNHDPGKGRYQQKRSLWDLLHPGRQWAAKLSNYDPLDRDAIAERVEKLCQDIGRKEGCFDRERN